MAYMNMMVHFLVTESCEKIRFFKCAIKTKIGVSWFRYSDSFVFET
jgi:hypothetical protein